MIIISSLYKQDLKSAEEQDTISQCTFTEINVSSIMSRGGVVLDEQEHGPLLCEQNGRQLAARTTDIEFEDDLSNVQQTTELL